MNESLGSLIAFVATGASGLALVPLATSLHWVDQPGGHKVHEGRPPLVGGLAIYLGLVVAAFFLPHPPENLLPFLAGATLLLAVGAIDDLVKLPPAPRFAAQIGAALIMTYWGGLVVGDLGPLFGGADLELGVFAVPFTLLAVVGVINAVNMIDGLDGLAGGLVLIALSVLSLAAIQTGHGAQGELLLIAAGAVLAFLLFNFRFPGRRRALMFMGDGGSLLLGYAIAWALTDLSQGPDRAVAPVTTLWILAVPLFDTVGAMLRRILKGQSPFQADRQHFHHVLLAAGLSVGRSVALMLGLAAVMALIGYGAERAGVPNGVMMLAILLLFSAYFWALRRAWRIMKSLHHNVRPALPRGTGR